MEEIYDVIIVGGGPAGLTAAIYLARAKYHVLVLEKERIGGQITTAAEVVNYPGIDAISGEELADNMRFQAEDFGASFMLAEVLDIEPEGTIKRVITKKKTFLAKGILLAVGASPRKAGFAGEAEWAGRGVSYCATCDGELFTGKEVFVIGGGNAAAGESLFLTRYAKKVTMLIRRGEFSCEKTLEEKVLAHPKIEVRFHTSLKRVEGSDMLQEAVFADTRSGEESVYRAPAEGFGIFVFVGYEPGTAWLENKIKRNAKGYILTDSYGETNKKGVYAAGDVCVKELRQVVTAVSDGAVAAAALEKRLEELRREEEKPAIEAASFAGDDATWDKKKSAGAGKRERRLLQPKAAEKVKEALLSLEAPLLIKAAFTKGKVSMDMRNFLEEAAALSDRLLWKEEALEEEEKPVMVFCGGDGTETGIAFHGVPLGHETDSFLHAVSLFADAPPLPDKELQERICGLGKVDIKIMVTLTCGMCPEIVGAAYTMARISPDISSHVYDVMHFPAYQKKYRIMSVPYIIINDEHILIGKRNISTFVEELEEMLSES